MEINLRQTSECWCFVFRCGAGILLQKPRNTLIFIGWRWHCPTAYAFCAVNPTLWAFQRDVVDPFSPHFVGDFPSAEQYGKSFYRQLHASETSIEPIYIFFIFTLGLKASLLGAVLLINNRNKGDSFFFATWLLDMDPTLECIFFRFPSTIASFFHFFCKHFQCEDSSSEWEKKIENWMKLHYRESFFSFALDFLWCFCVPRGKLNKFKHSWTEMALQQQLSSVLCRRFHSDAALFAPNTSDHTIHVKLPGT